MEEKEQKQISKNYNIEQYCILKSIGGYNRSVLLKRYKTYTKTIKQWDKLIADLL